MSRFLQKTVVGLVLALCLVAPLASATQRPQEGQTATVKFSLPTTSEMFVGAWSFLVRIRRGGPALRTKNGCKLDPHGACLPDPGAVSTPDNGCGLDPHGVCTGGS
jgi:hypothetical protein